MNHILGFHRFASTQILAMGSPVTSGNPSIDYFVSADRTEHPFRTKFATDQEHYTEQVVLLDGIGMSYPKPISKEARDGGAYEERGDVFRRIFNGTIEVDGLNVYTCAQHLFKLHPDFDDVLIDILARDEKAIVLLQEAKEAVQTNMVRRRLEGRCGQREGRAVCDRIVFSPRVNSVDFLHLLAASTVILHPFPFGGSKTSSDGLWCGTPVVVYPQVYLRGRLAQGFYYEMAKVDGFDYYECCIAIKKEQYAAKAVRLGTDREYRRAIGGQIRRTSGVIFEEESAAREWNRFLSRVLGVEGAAIADEKEEERAANAAIMRDLQRRNAELPFT